MFKIRPGPAGAAESAAFPEIPSHECLPGCNSRVPPPSRFTSRVSRLVFLIIRRNFCHFIHSRIRARPRRTYCARIVEITFARSREILARCENSARILREGPLGRPTDRLNAICRSADLSTWKKPGLSSCIGERRYRHGASAFLIPRLHSHAANCTSAADGSAGLAPALTIAARVLCTPSRGFARSAGRPANEFLISDSRSCAAHCIARAEAGTRRRSRREPISRGIEAFHRLIDSSNYENVPARNATLR